MKTAFVFLALCAGSLWAAPAGNPLAGIFGSDNLKRFSVKGVDVRAGERPETLVLRFSADQPGEIVVPMPQAARDWTLYRTFTFNFVSDSTIRWSLEIRNRDGKAFGYRVQPYENLPVKAAISAGFLRNEFMNNRAFNGHWLSNWGNHIDLSQVESLTIRMDPNRGVTLRLGPLALVSDAVADEIDAEKPVIDEFGQWIGAEWAGKIRALEGLRTAWKEEDAALAKERGEATLCRYGGFKNASRPATGFFHTAEVNGRWWLVDPDGHLFFSAGMDCVRHADPSPLSGREKLFVRIPPGSSASIDFYSANAQLRYGGQQDFVESWKTKAAERLRAWGFNTVANWSDPAFEQRAAMPFVTNVRVGRSAKNWVGFPDVYSTEFAKSCDDDAARQCRRLREEPMLIGYFIGNEPRWPGRNLLERILADPEASDTQRYVRRFLEEKGDTAPVRERLFETIVRHYFRTVSDAIRKADPNHMVLGIRWAGAAPEPVLKANDVFDVFSINIYRFEPPSDQLRHIYQLGRKPIMIGEFHFGAAERGLAPSLVMVKDQTERGAAYQYYVEHAAAQPMVVGTHYFQLCDQPASGRFDGENYNLGFVNVTDIPYAELVRFARETHRRLQGVHEGTVAPTQRMAKVR